MRALVPASANFQVQVFLGKRRAAKLLDWTDNLVPNTGVNISSMLKVAMPANLHRSPINVLPWVSVYSFYDKLQHEREIFRLVALQVNLILKTPLIR